MTPSFLPPIGPAATHLLKKRVTAELTTTFAQPSALAAGAKCTTAGKYLSTPSADGLWATVESAR